MKRWILVFALVLAFSLVPSTPTMGMTGSGTAGDPYILYTQADIAAMTDNTAYYELANDITFAGAWTPIFDDSTSNCFMGHFDGNGHSIISMDVTYSSGGIQYGGLFGYLGYGAVVHDLDIVHANLHSTDEVLCGVGILAMGLYEGGTIYNVDVDGTITLTDALPFGSSGGYVGGLVAALANDPYSTEAISVYNCSANVDFSLSVLWAWVGGFVGSAGGTEGGPSCTITDCYSTGTMYLDCASTGFILYSGFAGGFAGGLVNSEVSSCYSSVDYTVDGDRDTPIGFVMQSENTTYEYCFSDCTFTGDGSSLAGGAGFIGSTVDGLDTISNCYSVSEVLMTNMVTWAGFTTMDNLTIEKSYSVSDLTISGGATEVAGFDENPATGTDCFWNGDLLTEVGGPYSGATEATTAEMKTQSTFTAESWDFTTVWLIDVTVNSGYPALIGVTPGAPPGAPTSLTVSSNTALTATLTWSNGMGADGIMIRRKTTAFTGAYTDTSEGTLVYRGTATTYTDTGLSPSTTYYYRAWAYVEEP